MSILNLIIRNLRRPLVCAMLGLALLGSAAKASTIDLCVFAGGRWALIVPGSNVGGAVVYSPAYGCYITGRAARGETVMPYFWVSTTAENSNPLIFRTWLTSTAGSQQLIPNRYSLWAYSSMVVSTNPAVDNICVNITTVSGTFTRRIPVGGR